MIKQGWIEELKSLAQHLEGLVYPDDTRPQDIKQVVSLCEEGKFEEAGDRVNRLCDQLRMGYQSAREFAEAPPYDISEEKYRKMNDKANSFERAHSLLYNNLLLKRRN